MTEAEVTSTTTRGKPEMALGINIVHAAGYLGRDPEVRTLDSGAAVAKFSFASTETWRNKDGEKQERTTWFECQAWNKTAELVGKFFRKGDPIHVSGRYQVDEYEKDGKTQRFHYVKVDRVEFLPSSKRQGADAGVTDDDVPF